MIAVDGLWLLPFPLKARRHRFGYLVAIVPTREICDSEYFEGLCHSGALDTAMTRHLLEQEDPVNAGEIERIASFIRYAKIDQDQMFGDREAIEDFGQQLAWSYEEINLLYTITSSMTIVEQPQRFIQLACEELLATLPYAWIGAQLSDDQKLLRGTAGELILAGEHPTSRTDIQGFLSEMIAQVPSDRAKVIDTTENSDESGYARFGRTIVVQPIGDDGKVLGVLVAGEKRGRDYAASSIDTKLLGATATHMAIFLKNVALFEDLNVMFLGTLEALTASIDAKDWYTCGHSRRVAFLSQSLAAAAGLDERLVERMHIAGLVHDVGKIGVPERVLLKPDKLDDEEFEWIRRHPEMGYQILKDIPQLQDVLPGVLYHHERWDGRGYPKGLVGEEIPLSARLIGLADSFDAMSSTRTYRSARPREEVFKEIARCAGTQFDPELVPIFLGLDFAEYDRMADEHQSAQKNRSGEAA